MNLFLKDRLNQEIADRTGQPLDRIKQDTDRDFFMSPSEAVSHGLIDSVIDKRPVHSSSLCLGVLTQSVPFASDLFSGEKSENRLDDVVFHCSERCRRRKSSQQKTSSDD